MKTTLLVCAIVIAVAIVFVGSDGAALAQTQKLPP
jgi:hypothetical protein